MNWDEYFINIAEQVKLKSKDINTQIGVVRGCVRMNQI